MTAKTKIKYYPQHMHIHSIYEPGASMEGHMYFAKLLGIKYIWFTEHDVFWNKKSYRFGFEPNDAEPDENGIPTQVFLPTYDSEGEVVIDTLNHYDGSASMRLTANENQSEIWHGAAAMTVGKEICQSLCRMPSLSFSYRGEIHSEGDVRYIFDLCLSERPPDQRFAHILFVSGCSEGLEAPHTLIKPISVSKEWNRISFDIADIASSDETCLASVGGLDNVLSSLTVRVETRRGASASLYIDSLEVEGRTTAGETKNNQTKLAHEIGKKYGITPFVTAEISAGGIHKNCFSTDTPIFTYGDPFHEVTHEKACEIMTTRGHVFSLNHPFVHLKDADPMTVDYNAECDAVVEKLASDNAGGASLIEIGFPFGRYAPYTAHTRLWDSLAMRGVVLTGYGATDSHMMTEGWFSGNNFASFVGVDSEHEPTELDFATAMRAGVLYAANPLVIRGDFSFMADGTRDMGSISVMPKGSKSRLSFSLEITNHNWKVAWIVNGERVRLDRTTRTGYYGEYELVTSGKIDFVRVEVYDYFGTLLLMTNPVYFTTDIKNIKNSTQGRTVYK
jgi:hypothetical protein